LQPGTRLGRYEIRSLLGAGGMGEVYLAHDTQLVRPVALKVLAAALRGDEELRERLEYEARAASALNHPNILTVYDIGEEDDRRFIATEFVDGITLRQRLLRAAPSAFEVVSIGAQIASALAAAEAAGLVHRDVKPDNVMVRRDGYVKLLDFGLARASTSSDPVKQTDPYVVRGTVFYMSPEQLRGQPVDSRSDIWSLGVLLYELLTGVLPFDGDSPSDIVAAILRSHPPPLKGEVPDRLREIIAHALQKEREHRYQSAGVMLADLEELRTTGMQPYDVPSSEPRRKTRENTITERINAEYTPLHNLPHAIAPIVGRDGEVHEVVSMLRRPDVRLLTLTGPGGTGKTRLGIAAGAELVRDFEHGVFLVSLALIRDPLLVAQEIADTLGITEGGASLLDTLKQFLRDKSMLLILDNLEQVLDCAPVVADLLTAAPLVKALGTSRAPLHIRGEREYAVPPLMTPPSNADTDELLRYASVALFVERAASVKSDFMLTPENAQAVAELCVRLEGLPLAIELAAARVKLLPPQAMLARVGNRLQFLGGGPRDLPERQQTMRAAISWGYNLLDDGEKRLFEHLSVFRGGLSLSQAEALGGANLLDQLQSLVDKSFVRRDADHSEDEPRYTILETIREYGLERLAASGDEERIRGNHATLMASIAESAPSDTERLALDHDNFRAALEWCLAAKEASLALRITGALWWLWYLHGHYAEGRRWLEAALALPGHGAHAARAKALCGAGALAFL
ncbi:MAG TPA: protein kinase, partial [Thermoanaerobaculia bacterium]|nr:protein kinase [Thermoanaerobaculia bacterium]